MKKRVPPYLSVLLAVLALLEPISCSGETGVRQTDCDRFTVWVDRARQDAARAEDDPSRNTENWRQRRSLSREFETRPPIPVPPLPIRRAVLSPQCMTGKIESHTA